MRIIAFDIPEEFYKDSYFKVDESDLRIFLSNMFGYISESNEVEIDEIDIEKTITMHSGDRRIWYKDGGYNKLDAKIIMMKCENGSWNDIFEWMEEKTPNLFHKYQS